MPHIKRENSQISVLIIFKNSFEPLNYKKLYINYQTLKKSTIKTFLLINYLHCNVVLTWLLCLIFSLYVDVT